MFVKWLFLMTCLIPSTVIVEGQRTNSICDLPVKTGPCKAKFRRYYFNIKTGRCLPFTYGGCDGNENNFKTRASCRKACRKRVCTLPKDKGPCMKQIKRWYYNAAKMRCDRFIYGGCRGNKNNFRFRRGCKRRCQGVKKDHCPPEPACAAPGPGKCIDDVNIIVNGKKCKIGCTVYPCKDGSCPKGIKGKKRCSTNKDCLPSDNICCNDVCIYPKKPKKCPTERRPRQCIRLEIGDCVKDTDCPGNRKCCPFRCKSHCLDQE